jgi:hypothetical protein
MPPMTTREEYEAAIRKMKWPGLRKLWESIKQGDTPDWPAGKAFEYLVIRMFELNKAQVRWPYPVPLFGSTETTEEIDGSIRFGRLYCLVESKDESANISIGPIAKLRNQLLRRPAGTVGLLFSSRAFTDPAVQLAHFTLPQAILLWTGDQVEHALKKEKVGRFLEQKYRRCVDEGMPDYDITAP